MLSVYLTLSRTKRITRPSNISRNMRALNVMTDMQKTIDLALVELTLFNLPWAKMVETQLKYCASVIEGNVDAAKLEELNMGLIAVREIDERESLHSYLMDIQSDMQHKYLPFSSKVRLGIQRR